MALKGMRHLTGEEKSLVQHDQNGSILVNTVTAQMAGHYGGHNGLGTQDYMELLAGDACIHSHAFDSNGDLINKKITSVSSDGTNWTIVASGDHDLSVGDIVDIYGTTNYNRRVQVTATPLATTFTSTNTDNYTNETSLSTAGIKSADRWRKEDSTVGTKYFPDIEYFAIKFLQPCELNPKFLEHLQS